MRIAIMQPYLFPYIGYFQLINAVDLFVIFDNVNYIKRGWINRNRILVNGREYMFSVPLRKASQNRMIRDVEIMTDGRWRSKLLKTIEYNYKKAPYFSRVFPVITEIINYPETYISRFIYHSLVVIKRYLGIDTEIVESSSRYNNDTLRSAEKIIDICKKEGADHYINPIGGIDLYDKESFLKEGIKISFLKPQEVAYPQIGTSSFVRSLSIIDVMMNNPPSRIRGMLKRYELL